MLLSRLGGFDTDHQNGATVRATVQFHIPGPAPVALVAAEQRVKQATYQMTMTVRVAFLRLFRRTSDVIFPFSGALQAAELHMQTIACPAPSGEVPPVQGLSGLTAVRVHEGLGCICSDVCHPLSRKPERLTVANTYAQEQGLGAIVGCLGVHGSRSWIWARLHPNCLLGGLGLEACWLCPAVLL